jgi:predicted signal transduction protein with EAL and GGDEF domain
LLRRADTALYQAKNKGRNCCVLAEENPEAVMPGKHGEKQGINLTENV